MTTTKKSSVRELLEFPGLSASTPLKQRLAALATVAKRKALVSNRTLELLLGKTIEDNLIRFNEGDFAFFRTYMKTWEIVVISSSR
jgi:hypothetical protein